MENGIKTRNPSRSEVTALRGVWDNLQGAYGGEEWTGILLAMREVHRAFGFGHNGLDAALGMRGYGATGRLAVATPTESRCTACGRPLGSLEHVSGAGGPGDVLESLHRGATVSRRGFDVPG